MPDLAKRPHGLDSNTGLCLAIIETPKGKRSKFDYDRKLRAFRLKTVLPEGMSFPLDFGFIPSTLCDDGDPLDVMVLCDEPTTVGAALDVRLIGVIEAEEDEKDRTERNDRLLAVAAVSRLYQEGGLTDVASAHLHVGAGGRKPARRAGRCALAA
jgi:inorganic pyrophosphatase